MIKNIDDTIALLTRAMACDAAALPADTVALFLQATIEIRDVAAGLVARQAPPHVRIARNLRETCALLAFLETSEDSFVAEGVASIEAACRELAAGCADAQRAAAATAG